MTLPPKTALKLRCSQILSRGPHVVAGEDFVFLMSDVFPRHPDWVEKSGPGVSHVEVRRHGIYNSVGFFLCRVDGTSIDISYKVSLDGKGTVYSRVASAARNEILPQVYQWKQANPSREGMHCDHIKPFEMLLKGWLQTVGLSFEQVAVTKHLVGHTDLFAERGLAISWHRYHAKHAEYQWLTAEENIRKSNRYEAEAGATA